MRGAGGEAGHETERFQTGESGTLERAESEADKFETSKLRPVSWDRQV